MGKLSVVVSVDEAKLDDFPRVLQAMVKAGLHVENQMSMVGTVSGSVDDPQALSKLRGIEGVAHVEKCRTYQLAPPNTEVQ
ncbi:MAG TPA: hypothetical protein VHL31_21450 [Geminicoccus sp.]|uniref:hypothetical protein n=1 Tax=Geminicoccus sp. TaxID=2024832 RepID=UPI002E2FF8F2|nr:hypothetical protein [Geminicoccus sp.]HEX2528845.1 hypothetical protein [Geminicoccus sp.]